MSKVVVVTGAGSGIGRALSLAFAGRGDHVVVSDLDEAAARRTTEQVASAGGSAEAHRLDVTDRAAVKTLCDSVVSEHGRVDVWCNNAGIGVGGPVEELTPDHWDRVIAVNLRGVVHGVEAAYPVMVRQRSGHIVNTASLSGLIPAPLLTPYAMTKHAVVGLSESLRAEARQHGVGVTAVCPAFVDTAILDTVNSGLPQSWADVDLRGEVRAAHLTPMSPDVLAQRVLTAVDRDRALVVTPLVGKVMVTAQRWAPSLGRVLAGAQAKRSRSRLSAGSAPTSGSR